MDDVNLNSEFKRIWRQQLFEPSDNEDDYHQDQAPPKKDIDAYKNKVPGKTKKPSNNISIGRVPPRNGTMGELALKDANYLCESDSSHVTFLRDDKKQFMEKHHLIPMEFYFEFDRSIQIGDRNTDVHAGVC